MYVVSVVTPQYGMLSLLQPQVANNRLKNTYKVNEYFRICQENHPVFASLTHIILIHIKPGMASRKTTTMPYTNRKCHD